MSITVKVPTQLRQLTGGESEVSVSGGTVRSVIEDIEARYPGIRARLVDDGGTLRRFVNVYLNDEDVRFLQGLDTQVAEDARLSIIPAVAGG